MCDVGCANSKSLQGDLISHITYLTSPFGFVHLHSELDVTFAEEIVEMNNPQQLTLGTRYG
jgi:hypothetical protein